MHAHIHHAGLYHLTTPRGQLVDQVSSPEAFLIVQPPRGFHRSTQSELRLASLCLQARRVDARYPGRALRGLLDGWMHFHLAPSRTLRSAGQQAGTFALAVGTLAVLSTIQQFQPHPLATSPSRVRYARLAFLQGITTRPVMSITI